MEESYLKDREYLEAMIRSNKMELAEIRVKHRIAIAVYNTEVDGLQGQIDSMEKQLGENVCEGAE